MKTLYHELASRIRVELVELGGVVQRATRVWTQLQSLSDEQEVYVDSVALNLHSFYSGIERLFTLIGRHVDGRLPEGATWHRDLLEQMAQEFAHRRPAVIDQDTLFSLDEFRRFRHIVRNVYAVNLTPNKMAGLLVTLPELWSTLQAEFLAFADFLEEAAQYYTSRTEGDTQ